MISASLRHIVGWLALTFICFDGWTQPPDVKYIDAAVWDSKLDSLQHLNLFCVSSNNRKADLAANIALLYYPELRGHKIRVKYKDNVRYPITASWSFTNLFKFRRKHVYVLLIKPDSFVQGISLNKLVGLFGHEMAHFTYYQSRPAVGMAWWGMRYLMSRKFRSRFEREADKQAIEHGLGWQLLDMSIYLSKSEVREHMKKLGIRP